MMNHFNLGFYSQLNNQLAYHRAPQIWSTAAQTHLRVVVIDVTLYAMYTARV